MKKQAAAAHDHEDQHAAHLRTSTARLMLFEGRRPATIAKETGLTAEQIEQERAVVRDAGLDGGLKRHAALTTQQAAVLLNVLPRRVRAICAAGDPSQALGRLVGHARGAYYEIDAAKLVQYGRSARERGRFSRCRRPQDPSPEDIEQRKADIRRKKASQETAP